MMKVFVITTSVWVGILIACFIFYAIKEFAKDVREGKKGREMDERERGAYKLGPLQTRMDFIDEPS